MADKVTVSGPVEVAHASAESVAFNLMDRIAAHTATNTEKASREYWLKLYVQCRKAVKGYDLE